MWIGCILLFKFYWTSQSSSPSKFEIENESKTTEKSIHQRFTRKEQTKNTQNLARTKHSTFIFHHPNVQQLLKFWHSYKHHKKQNVTQPRDITKKPAIQTTFPNIQKGWKENPKQSNHEEIIIKHQRLKQLPAPVWSKQQTKKIEQRVKRKNQKQRTQHKKPTILTTKVNQNQELIPGGQFGSVEGREKGWGSERHTSRGSTTPFQHQHSHPNILQ